VNSRERVLAALAHRQPDRTPIDFGSHRSSGIAALMYPRLKATLGIGSGDTYVYDMVQQLAIVEPAVQDAVGVDVVGLGDAFLLDPGDWQDWVLPDGSPCKIPAYINVVRRGEDWYLLADDGRDLGVMRRGALYFDEIFWPWADCDFEHKDFSVEELRAAFRSSMWNAIATPGSHLPLTPAGLRELAAGAEALRASTDRAIIGDFGGSMAEVPQTLVGQERYLLYMALYPDACVRLSEALCQLYLEDLEKWLGAVGPYIDVVNFGGEDMGGQNGPLWSPAMYRRYFKPYHRRMWQRVRELADVRIFLHSCGSIEPMLEDLIDAGVDAINPVQISAWNMGARHLKATFGDRLTLWGGGCDTQVVLSRGTPEGVRQHVTEQVAILNAGGGFVFQQVQNIQAGVPPENIAAMFEAVRGSADPGRR
jgi:uroporphyrinogen decarboxylase